MVKIVEVEFNMEASDETMAAVNAATATPFKPEGKNCRSQG